jgi:predicted phage terminase large subunit-like protein
MLLEAKDFPSKLTPEYQQMLLRHDLSSFISECFLLLNPSTPFCPNWHIDLIASKLEACRQGRIKRLIINVPPRNLKSICATVAFTAWWLGQDPSAQILCASYAQDLANKHSMDTRSVMMSRFYMDTFGTRISSQRAAMEEFTTTEHGFRMATSVGGVLTGRGADVIILDDPQKPDEALSEAERRRVNTWYDHTLFSRLNHKDKGCIIIIMQRLHVDDLVGHVLERDDWEVVSLPAIAEEEERHVIETLLGASVHIRKPGEALHPERESVETLAMIQRSLGPYAFAGQYQQAPVPLEGGLVEDGWWGIYEGDQHPFDRVIQSWDTANKESEASDYSVCTTWGLKERKAYLLHVLRKRMNYPDLKRAVRSQAEAHNPHLILIEDKASGTQLIQELNREGRWLVKGCKPDRDKYIRLKTQTALIERGDVLLPRSASWLGEYRLELGAFPRARHDDQADSTSQARAWIQEGFQTSNSLGHCLGRSTFQKELETYSRSWNSMRF